MVLCLACVLACRPGKSREPASFVIAPSAIVSHWTPAFAEGTNYSGAALNTHRNVLRLYGWSMIQFCIPVIPTVS